MTGAAGAAVQVEVNESLSVSTGKKGEKRGGERGRRGGGKGRKEGTFYSVFTLLMGTPFSERRLRRGACGGPSTGSTQPSFAASPQSTYPGPWCAAQHTLPYALAALLPAPVQLAVAFLRRRLAGYVPPPPRASAGEGAAAV